MAAACVASGLRSSSWLWLEDDDRAMGILRVVLEATARLRMWNQRPDRAAKFEARGKLVPPNQWLEKAGWKKLIELNRALGEMVHVRVDSKWSGARSLLTALLPSDEDPSRAPFRARGFALDSVMTLAAKTALEALELHSPELRDHISSMR